ncbi:hypothetical protein GE09DRAFT_1286958 [Coniochaeta sp. 2T2.1]|nr:hypothetical protein GE09DRAFT_1286958 [Coniochaeta sp. 2T2.1]
MLLQGRRAGGHEASSAKSDLEHRDTHTSADDNNARQPRHPISSSHEESPHPLQNRATTAILTPRKPGEHGLATEAGIGVGVSIALVILLFVCSGCFTWRYRNRRRLRRAEEAKRARESSDTPTSEIVQTQFELDGGQMARAELHAGHGAGNTAEMDGDGPLAEMNGQGVAPELDHDEKAAMRQKESVGASSSSSTTSRDTKHHRVSVYEMETPPPTTSTTTAVQQPLSVQELAAYPFQRDEEAAPMSSSPESVTQQQLQYYIGGREAKGGRGGGQLGHVPSSEQELAESATTTVTIAVAGLTRPSWNMLMEEHRLLEERKMLQLKEIERRQAELRERIAAAKGEKDPVSTKSGSGGSDG